MPIVIRLLPWLEGLAFQHDGPDRTIRPRDCRSNFFVGPTSCVGARSDQSRCRCPKINSSALLVITVPPGAPRMNAACLREKASRICQTKFDGLSAPQLNAETVLSNWWLVSAPTGLVVHRGAAWHDAAPMLEWEITPVLAYASTASTTNKQEYCIFFSLLQ